MPRRALGLVLPLWAVGLLLAPAAAVAQGALTRCLDHAVSDAKAQGARALQRQRRAFLLAGDIAEFTYELPTPGCVGFLGVARRLGRDLDLNVHDQQGRLLARDETSDAHPYVRACVTVATTVHVSVTLPDGDGEFALVSLWDAPDHLVGLESAMASCTHAGQRRPGPVDVGPSPLGPPMGVALYRARERLGKLGYRDTGQILAGDLEWQGREVRRIVLAGDRCYALVGVGDVTVSDMDLRVFSPGGRPRLLVSDTTRRREALAKLCTEADDDSYLLEVRIYEGAGRYALMVLALDSPGTQPPPGIDSSTRLGFAELTARVRARGFTWSQHMWTLVEPGTDQPVPLELKGGRCYVLAALSSTEAGGLTLAVTDPEGNLIANDMGMQVEPLVYHCPVGDAASVRVWPKLLGSRKASPVLLLLASDRPAPPAPPEAQPEPAVASR